MTGISSILKVLFSSVKMASASSFSIAPLRLGIIEGDVDKRNEVIYHSPKNLFCAGRIVFFGGDMQDFKENMLAHRDNKNYAHWDLESTTALLHRRFPDHQIVTVRPAKMALMTFSCYENFVEVNNFGAPVYQNNLDALVHLRLLLSNVSSAVKNKWNISCDHEPSTQKLTLIGFSKGCVVLNQLLHSLCTLEQNPDKDLNAFVSDISDIFWLEGGHSGSSSTWITDKSVLQSFSKRPISVHIHVTPYQVNCDTRPRIGKEEKIFREQLRKLGMDVSRKLHFESEPRSLEKHFEILKVFHEN